MARSADGRLEGLLGAEVDAAAGGDLGPESAWGSGSVAHASGGAVPGSAAGPVFPEYGYWEPTKTARHLAMHRNEGLEVVYVANGELEWMVEGHVEQVASGNVFFTLPWQSHGGAENVQPGCELYFAVVALDRLYDEPAPDFRFSPAIPIRNEDTSDVAATLLKAERHAYPASEGVSWLIRRLVEELEREEDRCTSLVTSLAAAMVIELARAVRGDSEELEPVVTADATRDFLIQLESSCDEPWTLSAMAEACGLGRTRFAEKVKMLTGDTPITHLNRLRIRQAKRRLEQSDTSITDIAFACGFQSTHYFARVFKEFAGVTATEYRARRGRG